MIVGITLVSSSRQTGHWRSMYSTSVAGAVALPSTLPLCGIPANCLVITPASGSALPVLVDFELDEPPPETASTIATTTAITTSAATAPPITHGEALRPCVLRTGGRAT